MIKDDYVEITVNNTTLKWYKEKGYDIPVEEVQSYYNKNGKRIKNGKKHRVKKGTKILVKVEDLPPKSNQEILVVCENCGKEYYTRYGFYKSKKTNKCNDCVKKELKTKEGCQSYWIDELINRNPNAKCDISGETDKRFLVLHHLLSKSKGGKNSRDNYVILSANYHMAFHNSLGGTQYGCTPEQYYDFKEKEMIRINNKCKEVCNEIQKSI